MLAAVKRRALEAEVTKEGMVDNNWNDSDSFGSNLQNYINNILKWNKEVFGNIFANKKIMKARIKGIQIAQEKQFSHNLDTLERSLKKDLESVLKQEELLWLQKSRVQWITEGDRNTKFFHVSTIVHRKRNKIEKIKIKGNWSDDSEAIFNHINSYYNSLFSSTIQGEGLDSDFPTGPSLTNRDNNLLTGPISWYEVRKVIFGMKPLKAPGPDGFQPKFFQFYWDKVCSSFSILLKLALLIGLSQLNITNVLLPSFPKSKDLRLSLISDPSPYVIVFIK